uniref:Uncharacterized protein n=1 Tax=Arundo donax TaxID=35708 RepID=A0A0A9HA01_ARUDO
MCHWRGERSNSSNVAGKIMEETIMWSYFSCFMTNSENEYDHCMSATRLNG